MTANEKENKTMGSKAKELLSYIETEMQKLDKDEQIAIGGYLLVFALYDESLYMKREFLKGLENDLLDHEAKLKLFADKVVLSQNIKNSENIAKE